MCRRLCLLLVLCLLVPWAVWAQTTVISGPRIVHGGINYAGVGVHTTGPPELYTVTFDPVLASVPAGMCLTWLTDAANTGAASLVVNAQAAVAMKKRVGGGSADLVAGDLGAGQFVTACHDGTNFQVQSLGDSAAVAKLAGGGGQELTGTGVTPRRVAISVTDGVAAVPGPASADIAYNHNLIEGVGGDVHFNAPSGVVTAGQKLLFELLSVQAVEVDVSWDADAYCFNAGIASPTRTSGTVATPIYDYWQFLYNPTAGTGGTPCWVLVAIASSTEALQPGTLNIGEAGGSTAAYGTFTVPLGSLDLSGAINGSAGTPHLTYIQPSPPVRQTLTNTRIPQAVASVASTASLDPDCDLYEQYTITALAEALTLNIPGNGAANCTPTNGQFLLISLANSAPDTTHALTWTGGAGGYSNENGIALPTTTVANTVLAVQFHWNAATSHWALVGITPTTSPLTNPMTAPWDLIRGGTGGAPTALPLGTGILFSDTTSLAYANAATIKLFLGLDNVDNTADSNKNVATAVALAANGLNCAGTGEFATGVDAAGVAEGCAVPPGTPAGTTDGQVQYKNGTAFAATSGLMADANAVLKTTQKCTEVSSATTLWDTGVSDCVWVDTTAGNVTITIPAWASATNARHAQVLKRSNDANTLTLAITGNDTMNGSATSRTTTTQWEGWTIQESSISDNWYVETIFTTASVLLADPPAMQTMSNTRIQQKCTAVTSATTLWDTAVSDCVWVDTTAGNVTITIPAWASGVDARQTQVIKSSNDANTVTLQITGNDTMNGSLTSLTTTTRWTGWTIRESSATDTWYVETVKMSVALTDMAPMATDRLLGRDTAGAGVPEEISLDDTLEFTGAGALQRAALSGAVTANAGSNTTALAAPYQRRSCEIHIWGTGTAGVLQDTDDEIVSCYNDTGVTVTVVAVRCWANAGNSTTVMPKVTGGSDLLSGNLTCGTASWATGTLNGTPTLANAGTIDANVIAAGGTATNLRLVITYTVPPS